METHSILHAVEGGAEPQEGGGNARAQIGDPKLHQVYQCPNDDVRPEGTVVATSAFLLKLLVFC